MSSRKRSAIWHHFTEVEPKKAKCAYCANCIGITGGNVGNLNRHLKSKHPTVSLIPDRQQMLTTATKDITTCSSSSSATTTEPNAEIRSLELIPGRPTPAQQFMTDFVQNIKPLGPRRADKIDEQLIKMIAKGHHPFSIVDEPEFKKLIAMLCPGYSLPTRKTISNGLIPKIYMTEREKAKIKVAAAQAICLTTDGWTSLNNEHFIAIIAHYVQDCALQSTMLGCVQYADRTTAANLADFLKNILREWDAEHKITAIASDNAPNIVAAVRTGNWRHVPCFAHTTNLCVQTALSEVSDTTTRVKQVVEYFKRSAQALAKLKEVQSQLGVPQLKLKQDIITRWNSTFEMFRRLVIVKDAVTATLALTKSELQLNANDWATVEAAVPILKLFYDVTVEISSEKNVTLSKVIPLCRILSASIRKLMSEQQEPNIPAIQQMMQKLVSEFDRRLNVNCIEHSVLHTEATLLDPRFKDKGFRDKAAAEKAVNNLKLKVGSHRPYEDSTVPVVQDQIAPSSTKTSLWDEFDKEVAKLTPSNSTAAGIIELDKYLQEPLLKRTSDPFVWWQERHNVYPLLYHYMQKRLNILATSVPCERIFSKAGNILTTRRSQLKASKLSQLLFISCNTD